MSEPSATTLRLSPDATGITRAVSLLREGRLVAIPTETVYGLGADATDAAAVAAIYAAKERPRFNPLIAHLPGLTAARDHGAFDAFANRLAEAFWPGPLTLVVPALETSAICDLARAGLPSVALRVPDHAVARRVLEDIGRPLAAPSANRSGRVSPTSAEHVLADLDGRIAAILDAGSAEIGIESTVIACLGGPPRILRPGGISREALSEVLGFEPASDTGPSTQPAGPGMLASHYAPRAGVRLDVESIAEGEAALLFADAAPEGLERARAVENLSPGGDLGEAAARLFAALRNLDASGGASIAVVPLPKHGLGEAIDDRLRRAAAPR